MNDKKLIRWLLLLLLAPLAMAYFSGDRIRYPCQDPDNWDKKECQKPYCEVTRTCPEHIFKGSEDEKMVGQTKPVDTKPLDKGANCGK